MYDMPIRIDHDIPIMSILDLQNIASDRVRRHRLDEVESSNLERDSVDSAVFIHKVSE
jgi:hypothetical protein